ncbi:MAG: biopolymer transporter ExbD [Verrucomicrobium sp.]|jgi:biopolymer transport protein ExbD|nr:biopolymer transporter ExbD [Verrucomicrobium sp.]
MAGGGGGRSAAANSGRKGKFSSPIPIKKARIEIVPLIDVMFFLLAAFMMVSLSLQQSKTRPMELIDAKKASDDFKPDVLNIGVEKDGTVAIGTNVVDTAGLARELNARYKANPKTPVFITGDRSAPYRAVGGVLQQVRLARFTRVSFVTRESERARD